MDPDQPPACGSRRPGAMSGRLPAGAAVAGCCLNLLVMYPGMMMWDSIDQLLQARSGTLSDWHPPVMSFLWRWLDLVAAGPFPMLALQLGLLWAGGWLVVRAAGSGPAAVRIAVLFLTLLFPPVACVLGFITKDALLAGVLLCAFGLVPVVRSARDAAPPARLWCRGGIGLLAACLVLAAALRYNAIGAVWAASGFAIHVVFSRTPNVLRSLGLGLVAASVCVAAAAAVNGRLTAIREHPWKSVAAYDIAGVARGLGTVNFIAEADRTTLAGGAVGGEWTLDRMERGSRDWNHLLAAGAHVEPSPTLARVWEETIVAHPGAYLAHRCAAFGRNLAFAGDPVSQCVTLAALTGWREHDEQGIAKLLRHDYALTPVQEGIGRATSWLAYRTVVFQPGLYLGLGLVCLAWAAWPLARGQALPFFLAFSGLAQQATLFFLAPAVNYRYSHWLVTSAWLAFLLLASGALVDRARRPRVQA